MVASDHNHSELQKPLKKPYSIATTNQELQEDGTIWFVVKKVREGYMSEYLTAGINVGDTLHLQWPVWHMTDTGAYDNYLFISVGSGLSPMIGLYESIVAKQQFTKVAMLYWERYADHVLASTRELFAKEIDNTKKIMFLSREKDRCDEHTDMHNANIGKWDIDTTKWNNIWDAIYKDTIPTDASTNQSLRYRDGYIQHGLDEVLQFLWTTEVSVFICGKPEMVDEVRGILEAHGITKEQVKFEKY